MLPDDIALRALAVAATPGEWEAGEHCVWAIDPMRVTQPTIISDGALADGGVLEPDDAAYIAAASPAVIVGLLDRLAAVEALLTPTYACVADEVWGTNPVIEPIQPDDLRAALGLT
jgi:hypothetical protein